MKDDQVISGLVQLAHALPERRALLTSALSLPTLDPLAAVSTLRRDYPDLEPSVCSALVTQQQLLLAGADRGSYRRDRPVDDHARRPRASQPTTGCRPTGEPAGSGRCSQRGRCDGWNRHGLPRLRSPWHARGRR